MRLWLRSIKWTSESSSITLWESLKTAATARINETSKGRALIGTSSGGHSVSYMIPAGLSPVAATEAISYLLDLYETINGATPAPSTDDARFTAMMAELKPITETHNDFTSVRLPGGLYDRAT